MSDRIFYGTVFKVPTREGVGQVQAFVKQGFSVALASNTGRFPLTFSIAESHDSAEIREEFRALVEALV